MDQRKKQLKGSPSRDLFKQRHKTLDRNFHSCDIDFIWVSKRKKPPGILAVLDYKKKNDKITFSECLCYNDLVSKGITVYILQELGDGEDSHEGPWILKKYIDGTTSTGGF